MINAESPLERASALGQTDMFMHSWGKSYDSGECVLNTKSFSFRLNKEGLPGREYFFR